MLEQPLAFGPAFPGGFIHRRAGKTGKSPSSRVIGPEGDVLTAKAAAGAADQREAESKGSGGGEDDCRRYGQVSLRERSGPRGSENQVPTPRPPHGSSGFYDSVSLPGPTWGPLGLQNVLGTSGRREAHPAGHLQGPQSPTSSQKGK